MHPPLDRPHPECRDLINELKTCHARRTLATFWTGCNEVKFALDKCLKREKELMLREMNKDMMARRQHEEDSLSEAMGHKVSFDEYLNQDPAFQEAMKKAAKRKPGTYSKNACGAHRV